MANIENLKPFTKDNASVYGRKGGIASGITRRRKAYLKKRLIAYINLQDFIDSLTEAEYKDLLQDYTSEQQDYINRTFKRTEEETKELLKKYKKQFSVKMTLEP